MIIEENQKMDVITVGETMAAFVPELPGPLRYVNRYSLKIAGAESNLAIGLAKLGCCAGWIGRLGKDELGYYVRNSVRGEGVDTSQVLFDGEASTGILLKEIGTEESSILYYRSGSAASKMKGEELPREYLKQARIIVLTGITPLLSESCQKMVEEMVEVCAEQGILLGFDPNIRKKLFHEPKDRRLLADLSKKAQILMMGADEGKILFGTDQPAKLCQLLYEEGCAQWIAIKNGKQGAWVSKRTEREPLFIPPYPCRCIDPVGAGDAFNAGFIKGILAGLSLEQCGQIGGMTGALSTETMGDIEGYPDWERIKTRLEGREMVYR